MNSIPYVSTTGSVATSATGAVFTNLGNAPAHEVLIINRSGVELEVKTANSSVAIPLANGAAVALGLSASLAEVSVRRADQNNAQATVHFISGRLYRL